MWWWYKELFIFRFMYIWEWRENTQQPILQFSLSPPWVSLHSPCLSDDLRLSTPPVSYHCSPARELPEGFFYDIAFSMLLPWEKTANDFLESIISSLQSLDWFLKPLVKSLNLKHPTSNAFQMLSNMPFLFYLSKSKQSFKPWLQSYLFHWVL